MNGPREMGMGLFGKGDHDLKSARLNLEHDGPPDNGCFHCHQAIEKWLKAYLSFLNRPFPFVHELGQLVDVCEEAQPGLELPRKALDELTVHAVDNRYDWTSEPTREDLARALEVTERVRKILVAALPEDSRPPAL